MASAHVQPLQPATRADLVVSIGIAKLPFQVSLLTRDDLVAHRDRNTQREDHDPRASCGYADAAVEEKHAEIDGIAGPAVNAGRHQRAGGFDRAYRRPSTGRRLLGCQRGENRLWSNMFRGQRRVLPSRSLHTTKPPCPRLTQADGA